MKRILYIILVLLVLLPMSTMFASPYPIAASVFSGKPFQDNNGNNVYEVTDNDLSTSYTVGVQASSAAPHLSYTFLNPISVSEMWLYKGRLGLRIRFFLDDGRVQDMSFAADQIVGEKITSLNLGKPVKRIEISTAVSTNQVFEFDLRKIPDTTPPTAPQGLSAISGYDLITLNWVANTDLDLAGYNLYKDGVKVNSNTISKNSTTFNVVGGDYNTVYNFVLKSVDLAGNESLPSNSASGTPILPPDTTPPNRPYGLKAVGEIGQVRLTWQPNIETDLAGYLIYKDGLLLFTTPITSTDFVVSGGLSYTNDSEFSLVALDLTGNVSIRSTVVQAKPIKPIDNIPPAVPLGLKAFMTPDSLKIRTQWNAVSDPDLDGYYIYVSKDGGQSWTRTNPPPVRVNTYDIYPIDPDTEYQIKLISIDLSGNESGFSNTVKIKTPKQSTTVTPSTPTNNYIDISWLPIPGAVKYLIYYNGKQVADAAASTTTFRITKAMGYNPNGLIQVFDVKAQFANGSVGGGSNQPGKPLGAGWGFNAADIFTNSMWLIASVSSLVLFGLVMKFTPKLVNMIKRSVILKRKRVD